MRKNILLKGLVPTLVLFSTQAAAVPFQSIDPRSYGMGGTGTASGNAANAGFMNPALLATAKEDEDFALEFPIIAARIYEEDDVLDEIDNYQDNGFESSLTGSIDNVTVDADVTNSVAPAASNLSTQILKMSDKMIQGEGNLGLVVGIPSKKFGVSLTFNGWLVGGGLLDYSAHDKAIIDAMAVSATIADLNAIPEVSGQINSTGPDVVDTLTSSLKARGAVMQEIGLSFAREVNVAGHDIAVGVTPKYVKITTFDYLVGVNTADFETDQGEKEYTDFNLDVGVAKSYDSGWKTGLVVKNIISQEYETSPFVTADLVAAGVTAAPSKIKIEPQARVGISHSTEWTTVALDVDLAENEAVSFEPKTQFAALGAELDVFDTVQLRIGYRHNMSNSNTSIATAGIGFSVFGAHADIAVGANEDEIGGALQLGFRF